MFLAAALHHEYGFPICVMTSPENSLKHAWVMLPSGKHLDITGEKTLEEITEFSELQENILFSSTLTHLEALSGTKLPKDDPDVVEALVVAKEFLGLGEAHAFRPGQSLA